MNENDPINETGKQLNRLVEGEIFSRASQNSFLLDVYNLEVE